MDLTCAGALCALCPGSPLWDTWRSKRPTFAIFEFYGKSLYQVDAVAERSSWPGEDTFVGATIVSELINL